jgi:hypothetical protein
MESVIRALIAYFALNTHCEFNATRTSQKTQRPAVLLLLLLLLLLLGYSVPGGNKYRNLALQVGGVSKIETIKYA